jgi:hypothetical protein
MKKNFKYLWLFLLAVTIWSCSSDRKISSSTNRQQLATSTTYAWADPDIRTGSNPNYQGDIIDQYIHRSVDQEMASRGYVLNNDHPDILLKYHTYAERRLNSWGGYYYGYPYAWGSYWGYPSYSSYTEGYLILDVVDKQTNKTIWRGTAEGNISNQKKLSKRIDKGVHSIFKKFPVEHITAPQNKATYMPS